MMLTNRVILSIVKLKHIFLLYNSIIFYSIAKVLFAMWYVIENDICESMLHFH